jgi:dTDP-4-amino-4,6-dideoxygalactose transaminase
LEVEEVVKALRSGWITTGPRTKLLERRLAAYIETGRTDIDCDSEENRQRYANRAVCLNSATAAEELNLRILGVGPGDEVIVPAYTYTASASAAVHCGATLVFVDIRRDGREGDHLPEMDYDALEQAITPRTKAVIPVDLGGVVCDYDRIYQAVERRRSLFCPMDDRSDALRALGSRIQQALGRVAVVADCAHSLGGGTALAGEFHHCGALADFSSFSFHAVKNLTTAEGGAAAWRPIAGVDNAEIYRMYQLLSLHGQNKDALAKTRKGGWEYDIIGPWYKCNMTDIMAAIGLRQLDRYPGLLQRRREIMAAYDEACHALGVSVLEHNRPGSRSSCHLYLTRIPGITQEQRNEIIVKLEERGVATNVHYKPLPMMSAYAGMSGGVERYPNAYDYYHNLITLPCHTLLTDEDVSYVVQQYRDVVKDYL